jgi:hypothetical protein
MKIIIPGGSGQVGALLARRFHAAGHEVGVLSRHPREAPWKVTHWDGATPGAWESEINGADIVINLAGRSVNCRYHAETGARSWIRACLPHEPWAQRSPAQSSRRAAGCRLARPPSTRIGSTPPMTRPPASSAARSPMRRCRRGVANLAGWRKRISRQSAFLFHPGHAQVETPNQPRLTWKSTFPEACAFGRCRPVHARESAARIDAARSWAGRLATQWSMAPMAVSDAI